MREKRTSEKDNEIVNNPSIKFEKRVRTISVKQWCTPNGQNREREKPPEKTDFVRKKDSTGGLKLKRKFVSDKKKKAGKENTKKDESLYSDIRNFFEEKTVTHKEIFKGVGAEVKGQNSTNTVGLFHLQIESTAKKISDPDKKSQGN